jgi:hypothetical protein
VRPAKIVNPPKFLLFPEKRKLARFLLCKGDAAGLREH